MKITVQLLATYRRYLPPRVGENQPWPDGHRQGSGTPQDRQDSYPLDVAPGATVGEVLATLPLAPNELVTFLVNGRHAQRQDLLQPGDLLTIFPPAGGG